MHQSRVPRKRSGWVAAVHAGGKGKVEVVVTMISVVVVTLVVSGSGACQW